VLSRYGPVGTGGGGGDEGVGRGLALHRVARISSKPRISKGTRHIPATQNGFWVTRVIALSNGERGGMAVGVGTGVKVAVGIGVLVGVRVGAGVEVGSWVRVGVASGDWNGEGRGVFVGLGISVGEGVAVAVWVVLVLGVWAGPGVSSGVVGIVAEGSGVASSAPWSALSESAGCDGGAAWSGRAVPIARNKKSIASPDATSSLLIVSRFIVIPPRARDVLAL
jgi:hypothetical protein